MLISCRYRIMVEEDIIQAIFLHYIGLMWSVKLREILHPAFRGTTWKPSHATTAEQDQTRKYYTGQEGETWLNSESLRRRTFMDNFLLAPLPNSLEDGFGGIFTPFLSSFFLHPKLTIYRLRQQHIRHQLRSLGQHRPGQKSRRAPNAPPRNGNRRPHRPGNTRSSRCSPIRSPMVRNQPSTQHHLRHTSISPSSLGMDRFFPQISRGPIECIP